MPGTSGPELARELTAARLGLKTLFVSGYARDAADLTERLEAGHRLLAKPFSSVELGRVLAELLGPPPEAR
jgi:CheY-like chemotaxis protein